MVYLNHHKTKIHKGASLHGKSMKQKERSFINNTAIDEYSCWRYVEAFEGHSIYSCAQFLEQLT